MDRLDSNTTVLYVENSWFYMSEYAQTCQYTYDFCGMLSQNHEKNIMFLYISDTFQDESNEEAHDPKDGVDAG